MSNEAYTEFWNGQLLELVTSEGKTYYTQLIRNESELLIQRPVNKQNVPMLIENGMMVTVCFHDDKKGSVTSLPNYIFSKTEKSPLRTPL